MKNTLHWLPRVLAVLFIIFISVFAFDVLSEPHWFLALLMHLIPGFILAILTVIAWRHVLVGGFLFLAASLGMIVYFHSALVAVPAAVIGILFLLSKRN